MSELAFLGIADAARLIAARKLSPLELTDALLDRVAALDPQVNAFITVTGDLARERARKAEQEIGAGNYRGPLHGVPFALKDVYNTKGILTTGHSKVCMEHRPAGDATAVRALHDAGAVLLGKLATHEFAHGGPSFDLPWPPARNPWNPGHFSGGSSSGSAAALAAGFVPAALGTDTGGSIRGPSSFCGVVGLKPTYGLVSRTGVMPNSFTFDHCGPMARSVEDSAILLQAIAAHDPRDPASVPRAIPDYRAALAGDIRGIRIGVVRHFWERDLTAHPDHARSMDDAIGVLQGLGARVEDCSMHKMMDYLDVKVVIGETEIFAVHYDNLVARPADFGRDFLGRILPACLFQGADYVQACRERRRLVSDMRTLYEKYDVLLTAGYGPAPRLDAYRTVNAWDKPSIFTPFSVTAGPALALCCGYSAAGLPLGMQLVGRPFDEPTVFKVARAYERETNWGNSHPALSVGARPPAAPSTENETSIPVSSLDGPGREFVLSAARRTGLDLDDRSVAILLETAPYALALARRLRRPRDMMEESSLVFRATDGF